MYASCLFCNRKLGVNQDLESFPVGRRLAFDLSKGRLWVVCPFCARWNLTPLDRRWEAMEEAEIAYRAARLRRTTENIGLARVGNGLELVRIGKPPHLELAAWRYGEHLKRRRTRHGIALGTGLAAAALPLVGALGVGTGLSVVAATALLTYTGADARKWWRDRHEATVFVKDERENVIGLSKWDTWAAMIEPVRPGEWYLELRRPRRHPVTHRLVKAHTGETRPEDVTVLRGEVAERALSVLVPQANPTGATQRSIEDAFDVIGSCADLAGLVHNAATAARAITRMPAPYRLALEMVLHEEEERRALNGELARLEARWREAEEIADIADSLL